MGFTDRAAIIAALRSHKNAVPAAVEALLRASSSNAPTNETSTRHDRERHGGSHPQSQARSTKLDSSWTTPPHTGGMASAMGTRALSPPPSNAGARARSQPAPVVWSDVGARSRTSGGVAVADLLDLFSDPAPPPQPRPPVQASLPTTFSPVSFAVTQAPGQVHPRGNYGAPNVVSPTSNSFAIDNPFADPTTDHSVSSSYSHFSGGRR
ncbi:hypothetical protein M427DRAFT_162973 [Gonapodya prolifera JEL478]|uniref:UBA domain-containing protein n=1 Tax=Gonapodya prolifera (strain JEL478) TaxID=1344416 RepID=A0A139AZB8_GONPJ|nr:hypothetical protein M427DRAFT_162973 [Gonapodya prolifera JEL478]|eukprot:KXS22054.1 hypothetical protein M427DRAFT_162973 [Gonapodya prolifera JEL478]